MTRLFAMFAGVLGAVGVAAGAFGAHGLKDTVSPERLEVWHTAAQYHMLHALALLAVAWLCDRAPSVAARAAGGLLVAGVLVFCGSLYLLVLLDQRWLGAITPIGGVAFIAGWIALAVAAGRLRRQHA